VTTTVESTASVQVFPVCVLTARERVHGHAWIDERWRVTGVQRGNDRPVAGPVERHPIQATAEGESYLWTGLSLVLRASEVDAYYFNLLGATPHVYVLTQLNDDGEPVPIEVSLEYSEALAFSEFGNDCFAVPMPAELYRYVERFVLEHYVPEEPRSKRKRDAPQRRSDETKRET